MARLGLVPHPDGVSFSLDARYKDGIIWDGIRAVRFENGRPA
jgi:hypothetical protein